MLTRSMNATQGGTNTCRPQLTCCCNTLATMYRARFAPASTWMCGRHRLAQAQRDLRLDADSLKAQVRKVRRAGAHTCPQVGGARRSVADLGRYPTTLNNSSLLISTQK